MQRTKQYPKMSSFTDLYAWQEGHRLVLMIYKETSSLPNSEKYNLIDQLQRAVVSITSNIAEGFTRQSFKEKVQFMYISLGSVKEVENHLIIARDVGYISNDQFATIKSQLDTCGKLLQGLIKSFRARS